MVIAARLLNAQRWRNTEIATMEEWTAKMAELGKMINLTCLVRDKIISTFIKDWELDFLL